MTPNRTILAVDDNTAILKTVKVILESSGYEVLTAEDGCAALRVVNCKTPDLILLDLDMPVMDGAEFARRFRAAGNDQPIVILTGDYAVQDAARKVQAAGVVSKPFTVPALLAVIAAALG